MLPHPVDSLSKAKRQLASTTPPAPAEVAYMMRNLAGIIGTFSRVAGATRQEEVSVIARVVEAKLESISATLAAASGPPAIGSQGQEVTVLTGEALIRAEADEDISDFAESASMAVYSVDCVDLLRRVVREGGRSGQWQGVSPAIMKELNGAVEMGRVLDKQATQVVISGGGLGRRTPDLGERRFRRIDPDVDPTPPTPSRGPSL